MSVQYMYHRIAFFLTFIGYSWLASCEFKHDFLEVIGEAVRSLSDRNSWKQSRPDCKHKINLSQF